MSQSNPEHSYEKYGKWLSQVKAYQGRKVYCLSGGHLKTRNDIVDKMSSTLGIPSTEFEDKCVFRRKKSDDSAWDYWIAGDKSDAQAVGVLQRDAGYYVVENIDGTVFNRIMIAIGLLLIIVCAISGVFVYNFFAPGFIAIMGLGVTASTILVSTLIDEFDGGSKYTHLLLSDGYLMEDGNSFKFRKFIRNKFDKFMSKITKTAISQWYRVHEEGSRRKLPYSDQEALEDISSIAMSRTYKTTIVEPSKVSEIEDITNVVTTDNGGSAIDTSTHDVKNDIMQAARKELPNDSELLSLIEHIVGSDEADDVTLAKLEASLSALRASKMEASSAQHASESPSV
jgi:hypothetical protein